MAFETNRFCWQGCMSTDTTASKAFYTKVLGWSIQTMPMGDGEATMFAAADVPFAHIAEPPMPGVPSHWNNYLRVDDVDATAAAAVANGGTQLTPPADIPPGRFSIVASPSGATFTLFREAGEDSENHPGGVGSVHWVELHSKDLAADLAWLKATFGFDTEEMPMPQGTYTLLKHGGEMRGGAMTAMGDAPAMWLTWIHVADLDATLVQVGSNGGKAISPVMDIPNVGKMAIVQDPAGAVIGVITPAAA